MSVPSPFAGPGPDAEYRRLLAEGRFCIQRCRGSGRYVFQPRVLSPFTGEPTLDWVEVSGRGTVYSTTVIRRRPEQGGDYNLALIDLDEGCRLMSRVEGLPPAEIRIGLKVRARIARDRENAPILVFDPAESA
ncbi:MAG: DNA-binding protein [Alphaproteobacteria bacterium]|nr:DNA-binding protein [Alphaproteobacteria bacterium]